MDNLLLNFFTVQTQELSPEAKIIMAVIFLVSIAIKGFALFHAARQDEKPWFVALLLLNTFGILELAYLFLLSKTKLSPQNVREDLARLITRKK